MKLIVKHSGTRASLGEIEDLTDEGIVLRHRKGEELEVIPWSRVQETTFLEEVSA